MSRTRAAARTSRPTTITSHFLRPGFFSRRLESVAGRNVSSHPWFCRHEWSRAHGTGSATRCDRAALRRQRVEPSSRLGFL